MSYQFRYIKFLNSLVDYAPAIHWCFKANASKSLITAPKVWKSNSQQRRFNLSTITFTLYLLVNSNLAQSGWNNLGERKQFQVHGFATQGYIKTDNNNLFGKSTGYGSFDFREIGLVGSVKPSKATYLSAQLLSRTAGKSNDGEIDLDFAIFDYRIADKMAYNYGFRLGRIKNPYGLFNDTRDMAYTRQNILLPQSIYFERTRDLSMSSDGVEFYSQLNQENGFINFQFVVSKPRVEDRNSEVILLGGNKPGRFAGDLTFLGRVSLNTFNDKLILSYSEVQLNFRYKPTDDEEDFEGNDADVLFKLRILSAQLKYSNLILTAEYARRSFIFSGMSEAYVPSFLANTTGESYYLQLTYLLNQNWRIYTRYDILFQDKDDRYGRSYVDNVAARNGTGVAYSRYAKDYLVGVQWNISSKWMVRAELHEVEGVAWLSLNDNENLSETKKFWHAGMFSISYRF